MKYNSLFLFVSLCNSFPHTHSAVVTLDLLNGCGPVQDRSFIPTCSVDTCSSPSVTRACTHLGCCSL